MYILLSNFLLHIGRGLSVCRRFGGQNHQGGGRNKTGIFFLSDVFFNTCSLRQNIQ